MPAVFFAAAVFLLGNSMVGRLAASSAIGPHPPAWMSLYVLWGGNLILQSVLSSLVYALAAIAVHRFILLGETATPRSWPVRRFLRFVGWLLVFQILFWMYLFSLRWHLVQLILGISILILTVRLILIFPALAMDEPGGIEINWNRTRNQFWRIGAALVVALGPIYIVEFVVALGVFSQWLLGGSVFTPSAILMSAINALLVTVNVTVAAAIASWAYWDARAAQTVR